MGGRRRRAGVAHELYTAAKLHYPAAGGREIASCDVTAGRKEKKKRRAAERRCKNRAKATFLGDSVGNSISGCSDLVVEAAREGERGAEGNKR